MVIEKGRHVFSIGRHCDVCERCLAILKNTDGVNSHCDGEPLDDRGAFFATACEGKGYALGVDDAGRLVRDLYLKWQDNARGTWELLDLYRLMQRIGDLKS